MTRTAALEGATRFGVASGLHYRVYNLHRRWQVVDGIPLSDEAFYTVFPDGHATFQLGTGCRPKQVR